MKSLVHASLFLPLIAAALTCVAAARQVQASNPPAPATAGSTEAPRPVPQLGPNLHTVPEVPMVPDTNLAAAPATRPANPAPSSAPGRRNPLWVVLAVAAVLVVRFALRRFLVRSPRE
jgi:hypothetical protein